MKKQYFINANIIDPYNSLNEIGGLIIGVFYYFIQKIFSKNSRKI